MVSVAHGMEDDGGEGGGDGGGDGGGGFDDELPGRGSVGEDVRGEDVRRDTHPSQSLYAGAYRLDDTRGAAVVCLVILLPRCALPLYGCGLGVAWVYTFVLCRVWVGVTWGV